uniref:Uncharacterized protein n=1 Tax=Peronospora matthiolae TaxID=2874970 RepID=A0AAV1UCZ5_9STRA
MIPMALHVDNQAVLKQLADEASSLKAEHFDVRLKFFYDYARRGVVAAQYVRSELQLADLLTNSLTLLRSQSCASCYNSAK